jgi:hypothetical protein
MRIDRPWIIGWELRDGMLGGGSGPLPFHEALRQVSDPRNCRRAVETWIEPWIPEPNPPRSSR